MSGARTSGGLRRLRTWVRRTPSRAPGALTVFDESASANAFRRQHWESLLVFCLWLTNSDRAYAVGVANETLSRAQADPSVLRLSSGPARAWLFKLSCRLVIDDWRMDVHAIEEAADCGADCQREVDEREVITTVVSAAFACLARDEQTILAECYFKEASIDDVAHRLGVSPNTAKARAHEALRSLRSHVTDMGLETRLWAANEHTAAH